MKKIALLLAIIICIVSILSTTIYADPNYSYSFLIDGVEVEIASDDEITEDFAFQIATRIIQNENNQASINGIYCNLYGHTYVNTTATTVTHRYYSTAPRCLERIYSVQTCSVCGNEIRTLIDSNRISCCS